LAKKQDAILVVRRILEQSPGTLLLITNHRLRSTQLGILREDIRIALGAARFKAAGLSRNAQGQVIAGAKAMNHFILENDHFQFYAGDRKNGPYVDTSEIWGAGGPFACVSSQPFLVGIGTVRYGGQTRIQVEVAERPVTISDDWTKLGDFDLDLPSGELLLWAPETPDICRSASLRLSPGSYQGMAYCRGTNLVLDEMDEEGPDEYRIVLHPLVRR
jgi:hypothetical protein